MGPQEGSDERVRQETAKGCPVKPGMTIQFPPDTCHELILGQGGFEVQDDVYALAIDQGPDGAAAQMVSDAALQAVVRKGEVALFLLHQCAIHIQLQAGILDFKSREGRIVVFRQQRRLAREDGRYRMPGLLRQAVPVSRRSRYGIGFPAGRDDHRREVIEFCQAGDRRAVAYVHPQLVHASFERPRHVARHQRGGIHAPALQRDGRHTQFLLEKPDDGLVGEGPEGKPEKAFVRIQMRGEFLPRPGVGEIAAAFAREIDLASEPFVLVKQHHTRTVTERFGGPDGRHHARRPAADDAEGRTHLIQNAASGRRG